MTPVRIALLAAAIAASMLGGAPLAARCSRPGRPPRRPAAQAETRAECLAVEHVPWTEEARAHSRIVLLLLGWLTGIGILTTIGIILLVIGAVLWILGSMGRPVGRRRPWW
jgi:hypothetical protein